MRRVRRPVVGLGPVGSGSDDRLERVARCSQPADLEVERDAELLLGELVAQPAAHVGQRLVRDGGRRLDPSHLAVVLDEPQVVDQARRGHQLDAVEPAVGEGALLGPGHGVGLERQPPDAGGRHGASDDLSLVGAGDHHARLDPGGGELLGGLLAVAPVGHQDELVGEDEQQAGRSCESGEVAEVDQLGDQDGVGAGLSGARVPGSIGQRGTQARRAGGHVHGRQAHDRHRMAASTANAYPWPPKPATVPVATGATTDVWRHGSRAFGFERWSSTTGPANEASASWMPQA